MDHQWPAELTADARCEACGLAYGEWSLEDPDCPGTVDTSQWDRLPEEHEDYLKQCCVCHVTYLTEVIARECEERHDRRLQEFSTASLLREIERRVGSTPTSRLRREIAVQREILADLHADADEQALADILNDIEAVLDENERLTSDRRLPPPDPHRPVLSD